MPRPTGIHAAVKLCHQGPVFLCGRVGPEVERGDKLSAQI